MVEKNRIWLSPPHMSGKEQELLSEIFATNWIAPVGPHLEQFEQELTQHTKVKHALALASGTAAIHLALIVLGVKEGDEVLCPSLTFAGSIFPIIYQGARPIFIDSEQKSWNMSPELLKTAIEDRISKGKTPKAAILVDLYGMPADYDQLLPVLDSYDIPVIEDAAEALGGTYKGAPLGSFGAMSVLSFNGNKIITTSGGGALLSNNKEYIEQARFLSTQARDEAPHYEHSSIGYNYRMSNVLAGIGLAQLKVLKDRVEKRRVIFDFYKKRLGQKKGLCFLEEPDKFFSNRWLTNLLIDTDLSKDLKPQTIQSILEEHNIEARPFWKPMHQQPVFKDYPFYGDGSADKLFKQGLCLPSGSSLTEAELERICSLIDAIGCK